MSKTTEKPIDETLYVHKMTDVLDAALTTELHDWSADISGKLLTFIEATIQDPEQRKAAKDILKSSILFPQRGVNNGPQNIVKEIIAALAHALLDADTTDEEQHWRTQEYPIDLYNRFIDSDLKR